MLTFQGQYQLCQKLAQDTDATNLTFFKQQINDGNHLVESELGSFVTETTITGTTVAGQQSYNLPDGMIRLKQCYVTVGVIQYNGDEVFDEDTWRSLS